MSSTATANNTSYGKPNMAALESEWGRRIIEQIRNTPRTDFTELSAKSEEVKERIRKAKADGSF